MKTLNRMIILSVVFFFAIQVVFSAEQAPKYIFLFIGDGMGTNLRTVADLYYQSKQIESGVSEGNLKKLEMNDLPFTGNMTTFAFNSDVTDSAAAVTAMATGYKTNRRMLGVSSSGMRSPQTVAECAKENGFKVGILSSVWLNHATPAGYYSHQISRDNYFDIAVEMLYSDFDFFGASGLAHADKRELDIFKLAREKGYTVIDTPVSPSEFEKVPGKSWIYDKKYSTLPYRIDDEPSITLADYTEICVKQIENPDGFFVMVEGGKIDWVCHSNDLATSIKDTLALNDAFKVAFEFYDSHKEETLIIVTADHETGGLNLDESQIDIKSFASLIDGQLGSDDKFQKLLKKIKDNKVDEEMAFQMMQDFFGLDNLTVSEKDTIRSAYIKGGMQSEDFAYENNHRITIVWTQLLAARVGIKWQSLSHTSLPVMVSAIGVGAEYFAGNIDNTCLARYLMDLIEESNSGDEKE